MTPLHAAQLILFGVGSWLIIVSFLLIAVLNQYRRALCLIKRLDKMLTEHLSVDPLYYQEGFDDD